MQTFRSSIYGAAIEVGVRLFNPEGGKKIGLGDLPLLAGVLIAVPHGLKPILRLLQAIPKLSLRAKHGNLLPGTSWKNEPKASVYQSPIRLAQRRTGNRSVSRHARKREVPSGFVEFVGVGRAGVETAKVFAFGGGQRGRGVVRPVHCEENFTSEQMVAGMERISTKGEFDVAQGTAVVPHLIETVR